MKQERKFRFVGDPKDYHWDNNPIHGGKYTIDDLDMPEAIKEFPEDWEEVAEQEGCYAIPKTETNRIPNQDQPASEMTKFEMAVLWNLKGIISNPNTAHQITAALGNNVDADTADKAVVSKAIKLAKETFKQLENLKK